SKYVKGVDLNLGVNSYEDYSSGQQEGRTQLEVGVSKTLLNDKITVQVGGNIDIEGEKAKQNNASDVAGNISLEYKLTEDGRFRLKGYRKNEYENPIEGELIKTGFGIIYRRNYNKLKELFSKSKPKKKISE
ncbi:MAG TPA: translocation/assembly module TamB domain-containing protein, partial [Bacteroidia bacterium]|nr:translocation/assembly module TamB domain-containing protein [Bacteroidia bacterium]